jgi:predicted nucleic acid-binding protein
VVRGVRLRHRSDSRQRAVASACSETPSLSGVTILLNGGWYDHHEISKTQPKGSIRDRKGHAGGARHEVDRYLASVRAPLVAVKTARFVAELAGVARVGIDSAVLIYHLEDIEPYSELTEAALGTIAAGRPAAVVSTISLAEVLVKPYRDRQPARIAAIEGFVTSMPNTSVLAPSLTAAKDAARLRAKYGIRLPDALLVATSREQGAQAFLTNDAGLRRLRGEQLTVIVLDDYVQDPGGIAGDLRSVTANARPPRDARRR